MSNRRICCFDYTISTCCCVYSRPLVAISVGVAVLTAGYTLYQLSNLKHLSNPKTARNKALITHYLDAQMKFCIAAHRRYLRQVRAYPSLCSLFTLNTLIMWRIQLYVHWSRWYAVNDVKTERRF